MRKWEISAIAFPDSSVGKESTCNTGDPGSIPGLGRSPGERIDYPLQYTWDSLVAQLVNRPWRREQLPTLVFWPREFHGLCSPLDHKELDTTETLSLAGEATVHPELEVKTPSAKVHAAIRKCPRPRGNAFCVHVQSRHHGHGQTSMLAILQ